MQEEYSRIWDEIRGKATSSNKKFIVAGTAGIGKSLFRLYLLRRWLKGDETLSFARVILNIANAYYVFDRNGEAKLVAKEHLVLQESQALLVPCYLLHRVELLLAKLTILTTSVSSLAGQIKSL